MEQDPLTAAKLPLSARPRSSSSPQKEASGPSFFKKKKSKKRTKQQKEKPKREKNRAEQVCASLLFYHFHSFFSFIFLLSRALSPSLSLSVALALSLAVSRTNCVGYYNFHALAPEFGSSETSTYLRRWRKVRLGLKKIIYLIFFKGKKKSIRFLHFSHTHTQTHASLRSARRLPPRCPVEASCGVVTAGEKLLFVGRLSPHRPGEKKGDSVRVSLFFLFIYLFPLVLDLI